MKTSKKLLDWLSERTVSWFFARKAAGEKKRLQPLLAEVIQQALDQLPEADARKLVAALESVAAKNGTRSPPNTRNYLLRLIGMAGLLAWASNNHPRLRQRLGANGLGQLIGAWLDGLAADLRTRVLEAGVRFSVKLDQENDRQLLRTLLGSMLSGQEANMAVKFDFDSNRLPQAFNSTAFKDAVFKELRNILSLPATGTPPQEVEGAIIGMLLLDEQFDHTATGFVEAIRTVWLEFLRSVKGVTGTTIFTRDVYTAILALLPTIRPPAPGSADTTIFYQELATVGRYVMGTADQIPPGHPNFITQVRLGLDRYVAGKPQIESLELPPLTGEDGTDVEIEPENIRVVGLLYAGWNLEEMRLFQVVDRITEVFYNGALPIGSDAGGRALDTYYWDREDRLNEAERRMVFSRVLGAPGGMISKEVQPNTQFESLWLRFLSSLAEFDRQQRVDEIIDTRRRPQNLTAEYVRKAGRDLAANVSLYGWGGTHFAARRINTHVATALDILKQPSIQKAYGVTNAYQVIERVAPEFGVTPDIVRRRTMAESGNEILRIVAKHHRVWTGSTGKPLFDEINPFGSPPLIPGDISAEDRQTLMTQTQFWLAVNGIKDDQVDKLSQPEQSRYEPSLPSFASMTPSARPATNGKVAPDTMERLKQMVLQGQAPSIDQLKQMLPM